MPRREADSQSPSPDADRGHRATADAAPGIPRAVIDAYAELAGALDVRSLSGGLLHRSYLVHSESGDFVLQRVSEVFAPEIHANIEAVTRHLAAKGLTTFELRPTRTAARALELGAEGRWRLLTRVDGVSFGTLQSRAQARSAAALVGRFHAALEDFDRPLAPMGLPFRDTPRYLARMRQALVDRRAHRLAAAAARLAERVEAGLSRLGEPPTGLPERVIHGDLKIDNLLFAGPAPPARDRAVALIDLDTLMRAPLWCEWGDAWRSWCARASERDRSAGVDGAGFDLAIFEASVEGFREGYPGGLSERERASLLLATERLALELAARFVTDVVEESYFAWDAERHASAADHNLQRAQGQLAFFESAWACRRERAAILEVEAPAI